MSIIDLQEVTPNNWRARYQGNYGTYTIKIAIDGKQIKNFSCSCPSGYYPCKHIPIVEKAIWERIVASTPRALQKDQMSLEELMKKISPDELRQFVIRLAKYNPELTNTIFLEFSHKMGNNKKTNNYAAIIRKGLKGLDFDDEDLYEYDESYIEIDCIKQWIDKARQYHKQGNDDEAILICKACIEEYAEWLHGQSSNVVDYISEEYVEDPFDILSEIVSKGGGNPKELFDYCKREMSSIKYTRTGMQSRFNDLLLKLAPAADPDEFIRIQDLLLSNIANKASSEAAEILKRKMSFYQHNNQPEKAWEIVTDNIQIEDFRKMIVKNNIAKREFAQAKKLIHAFLASPDKLSFYTIQEWKTLLLDIAREEHDTPTIREIALAFLKDHFQKEYYQIYKSAFDAEEWPDNVEKLLRHYQGKYSWFSDAAAEIFIAEGRQEELVSYVNKHLSVNLVEKYYTHFPSPEQTLEMFQRAIDQYAANNLGRDHYEYIALLMKNMKKINGGRKVVSAMIAHYKTIYKNRRAMMEILNRIDS